MTLSRQRCIQNRLRESFTRHTGRIALRQGKTEIPYRQLAAVAENYARAIDNRCLRPGDFTAICLERKIDLIAAVIGALMARSAFVPLDPSLPQQRLEYMLRQVAPQAVIADSHTRRLVSGNKDRCPVISLESDPGRETEEAPPPYPWKSYEAEDRIYAYFTSGSSGRPKAIAGMNKSLDHFIEWEIDTFGVDKDTRVSQLIAVGFDAFLRDMLVPLCSGGSLCIPPDRKKLPVGQELADWLETNRINLIHCVPSVFRLFNLPTLEIHNFPDLRYVLLSGERISPDSIRRWIGVIGDRCRLVNLYGPSETTMIKTFHHIEAADLERDKIPAGKAMRGSQLFIFDRQMKLCGKERVGEIYIRTPYRTLGYLNDPEMTHDRFIPNPAGGNAGDRLYRTGDLGRILEDGNLELLGRIDRQVKIRGVRVEPEETEIAMCRHERIMEAAVTELESGGESALCGYYTATPALDPWELREYLNRSLPDYLVPAHLIPVERIPLTPNGKVDRQALPLPGAGSRDAYAPPRDNLEHSIACIMADVLGAATSAVGRDTDIFSLGANSLKIIVALAAMAEKLHIQIPFQEAYTRPTIALLANFIRSVPNGAAGPEPMEKMDYYPVSPAQKRLYMQQHMDAGSTAYNMPRVIRLEGEIDCRRLERALERLLLRHESLRTYYLPMDETVIQRVAEDAVVPLERSAGSDETEWVDQFIRPFRLQEAPLMRAGILQTGATAHLLMIDLHHIAADGASLDILVQEFILALDEGELPAIRLHYRDYALWLCRRDDEAGIASQEAFWLELFSGELPLLDVPIDYPRPPVAESRRGGKITFPLDGASNRRLLQLATEERTTLYCVLLAVFTVFLARLTGREDIVVGSPAAGRPLPSLNSIVGVFINMLALRNFPRPDLTFRQFLQQVTEGTVAVFANQDYPFEDLVERVAARRDPARHPLFDVLFQLDNRARQTGILYNEPAGDLHIRQYTKGVGRMAKFDISCIATEFEEQLTITFEYATHLFKRSTIDIFIGYFTRIATIAAEAPDTRIGDFSLRQATEKKREIMNYLCDDLENEG